MVCSGTEVAGDSRTGAPGPDHGQSRHDVLHSLPLLVFEHQPTQNETTETTRGQEDGAHGVLEMFMFSISEERRYTADARPAMLSAEDKMCSATPQGWIFITQDAPPWEAWLWHPLTGETIPLPPIQDDHYIPTNSSCLLTHSSAAHPDCAVVVLDICGPNMWFCRINGGSSGRAWGQHTYDVGEYILPDKDEDSAPTKRIIPNVVAALGGKLHFVFSESNNEYKMGVVHLDFSDDRPPNAELHTLEGVDAAVVFPEGMHSGVLWLLESEGQLFQVSVCFQEFDADDVGAVLVHRMDFDGDRGGHWRRVHDIGDRVFMLPHEGNAVSCSASTCSLQGNRVYFMKNFVEDDGNLCIYDLKDQVMKIVAVHERDLTLARTKPYWIVPPV